MKRFLTAAALALGLAACKKAQPAVLYEKVPVERRDITVTASASGTIQPILTVQVKSQASGAITEMRVQTGDDVHPGQVLTLIDPRLPKSALDQAKANLDVAKAQYQNTTTQLAREDTLFRAQAVTQTEYDAAKVTFAQAKAALVNAQANLSDAQIAYDQTRVTAPLAGTIIQKNVELGTVISSPTRDVGGGTVLFQMANLDTVQVQSMVDETDIGKVQPGLPVTITVDAYPSRPFQGTVRKIEPQATVQQNVTMFPVLVNILNPEHLLKPGMNAEVEVHVGQRQGVLAIPNSALRTQRDVASAAQVLGLNPQDVQAQLAAASPPPAPRMGGDTAARTGMSLGQAAPSAARPGDPAPQGSKRDSTKPAANVFTTADGRQIPLPAGVTAEQVRAAMQKRFTGGELTPAEQAMLRQVFSQFAGRSGAGGGGGGMRRSNNFSGNYIVFALRNGKPTPVNIRTGLTDLDYVEVTSGLAEKDTVLLLPSASLVQSQTDMKNRFQNMTGGGLPGLRQQSGGSGTTKN
ncbi:MAG TPA: efflux RND transporter periplasmic adaptor subunit [Chloroflexota bacterium]|nr:efflux RND transporter periplasmic adaptor subunit [Chloroflexota bacterium]